MSPEQEVDFSAHSMRESEVRKFGSEDFLQVVRVAGADVDFSEDIYFVGIAIFHVPPMVHLAEAQVFEGTHAYSEGVYPQRPAGDGSWWKTSSRASKFPELVLEDEFFDEEGEDDASDCECGD